MGACVSADAKAPPPSNGKAMSPKAKNDSPATAPTTAAALPSQHNSTPSSKPHPTPDSSAPLTEHIAALQPLFCERPARDKNSGKDVNYIITAISRNDLLEFGCTTPNGQDVFHAEVTVQQLEHQLRQLSPPVNGASFVKALTAAFRNKTVVLEVANVIVVKLPINDTAFPVGQLRQSRGNDKAIRNRLFAAPLFHYWFGRKGDGSGTKAIPKAEAEALAFERSAVKLRGAGTEMAKCRELRKRIQRLQNGGSMAGKSYDPSAAGPYTYVLHHERSQVHIPSLFEHNEAAMALIRKQHATANESEGVKAAPTDAELQKVLAGANTKAHEQMVVLMDKIDDWGFDMFEFAKASSNTALFHVTYALLHKHGLMGYFNFDNATVTRFLGALEGGYHPNHYHNATHAADVLQCVHYILGPGGMIRELGLNPEEVLAAILASAMHDYDHPGVNNVYHIKTGAYLATLYNDRSVLENHHCASVFELLRHDRYNIFRNLPEDQRKAIRDTMLEMVLSTDMGLHGKIFTQFKQRQRELEGDGTAAKQGRENIWKKPDDRRLALSIALKMADISNCARPLDLYKGWAARIADEFYMQGDLERECGMAISPFMDRTKHDTDFPKGQISFMRYIAIPLFEAGADFLPKMDFTVPLMQKNKDHWPSEV